MGWGVRFTNAGIAQEGSVQVQSVRSNARRLRSLRIFCPEAWVSSFVPSRRACPEGAADYAFGSSRGRCSNGHFSLV